MLELDGTAALGVVTALCDDFPFVFTSTANSLAFRKPPSQGHFPPGKALRHVSMLSLLTFSQENGRFGIVMDSRSATGEDTWPCRPLVEFENVYLQNYY